MTAPLRLLAFAAALAAVFGLAALAGGAVDPGTRSTEEDAHAMEDERAARSHGDEGGDHAAAAAAVKGLAVTDGGYTLELVDRARPAGRPTALRFRVLARDGAPLTSYDVEHERRMHLIVARRDNRHFQHLHPRMRGDGTWVAPMRFAAAGAYRVFADFTTGGTPVTLGADLAVDGDARYAPLPDPASHAAAGHGYRVRLAPGDAHAGQEQSLRFAVTRDGRRVRTQPYLGAGGHLVALREGDLAFLHTHPAGDGELSFATEFPTAGRYRLYLQFKAGGEVHTAAFTREVAR